MSWKKAIAQYASAYYIPLIGAQAIKCLTDNVYRWPVFVLMAALIIQSAVVQVMTYDATHK